MKDHIIDVIRSEAYNIARYTGEVMPELSLRGDLKLDEISIISLAMDFETFYHIEITDAEVHSLVTVDDVVKFLEKRVKQKA